jgi:hypothetical protein
MPPAIAAALAAMRSNLVPGLVLWTVAAGLVCSYYLWPAARPVFDTLYGWQLGGGTWFAAAASTLCGGLLPWLFLAALGRLPAGRRGRELAFLTIFWVYRGVEVYWFYRFQSWLFGDGTDALTLTVKTAFDMLVYSACWTMPGMTLVYAWWYECDRDWGRWRRLIDRRMFTVRIPSVVISGWMLWTPSVAVIYSFPQPLQAPVSNVVLCFWVLLAAVVAGRKAGAAESAQPDVCKEPALS